MFLCFNMLTQFPDHAGAVCSGQQSRCPNATEASRHDGPKQESYTGQYSHTLEFDPLMQLFALCFSFKPKFFLQ